MIRLLLCLFLLAWAMPALASDTPCQIDRPCLLGERSYHLREPDDWDRVSPLPVLVHFHGWMRTGALPVKHQRISGATRRRGVLLVAPNGRGKTWDFWTDQTDDVAFAARVIEDVARRYPIDRDRIFVSGYSYGGAMAWRYVCQRGNGIAALLAVSGSIRQSETCPEGPAEIRHVHGLADTVMRYPLGPGGDIWFPVSLWREKYGCDAGQVEGPWQARSFLTFKRILWSNCKAGREIRLDVHPGGHFIPHGWIARQLDELLGLPPSYP